MKNTEHQFRQQPAADIAGHVTFAMLPLESLQLPQGLYASGKDSERSTFDSLLPLVVVAVEDGRYLIVDGCKRYEHLRASNRPECACAVLAEVTGVRRAMLLRVLLNSGRPLSIAEKIMFIGWLRENLTPEDYEDYLVRLKIEPRDRHEIEGLALCQPDIMTAVLDGYLVASAAPESARLCQPDRQSVLELFREFGLSRQMQREFLEWIVDISIRDNVAVADFLEAGEIGMIRTDTRTNAPQKIQKIRELLYQKRFPQHSSALRNWRKVASRSNPDQGRVTFVPSEFFEKDRLEIRVTVSSPQQAKELLSRLAGIPGKDWDALIRPAQQQI